MKLRTIFLCALVTLAMSAGGALAQSDIGFKKVGAQFGIVNPEDVSATWGIGLLADLGTITPQIGLQTYVDFWSKSEDQFGFSASVRDISVGARAKYFFPVNSVKVHPYAGAGLGLHFVSAEAEIPDIFGTGTVTVSDSETKLGLDIGGGLTAPIGDRTDFISELWFGLVSDVSQMSARIGVAYRL